MKKSKNFAGWTAADVAKFNARPPAEQKTVLSGGGMRADSNFFKRYAIYVGIDAGKDTGVALWLPVSKSFLEVRSTDFWGCIEKLMALSFSYDKKQICVVVEDPSMNKFGLYQQRFAEIKDVKKRDNYISAAAQRVGSVKRESQLIVKFLERQGWPHITVRPTNTKKNAEEFKRITGWNKATNQHARDAAMLVFGR